jgi:hypothetical protein
VIIFDRCFFLCPNLKRQVRVRDGSSGRNSNKLIEDSRKEVKGNLHKTERKDKENEI